MFCCCVPSERQRIEQMDGFCTDASCIETLRFAGPTGGWRQSAAIDQQQPKQLISFSKATTTIPPSLLASIVLDFQVSG